MQQTYLEGMSDDPELPFQLERDAAAEFAGKDEAAPGMAGPTVRTGVDTGAKVIDLRAMIAEMEANPEARRRR